MTIPAIRQFIAICGPTLCKGARYEEPLRGREPAVAFIMGQCDYIAVKLIGQDNINCPFVVGTADAERWARGKWYERHIESFVVESMKLGRLA